MPVILRLERAGERGHGLVVGVLQQPPLAALELEQVTEIAGVEQQLLVRLSLAGGPERGRVQPGRHALDHGQQLERAERLQEQRVGVRPPARPPRRSRRSRSAARPGCCASRARFSAASTAPTPSRPGMATSITIASGRAAAIRSWAAIALAASSTSTSTASNVVRSSARNASSSSTSKRRRTDLLRGLRLDLSVCLRIDVEAGPRLAAQFPCTHQLSEERAGLVAIVARARREALP